jgi:branched-chain amino acid transport system permease protein
MDIVTLLLSVVKILAVLAWVYGVLWVLGRKRLWVKIVGIVAAWGIVQLGLTSFGGFQVLNDFDRGLLFQAAAMTMVALGLNLIYGFNGQFSLGQWGFYGLGAYAAADITYRWVNRDASGVFVAGLGVILGGLMILGVSRLLRRLRGMPVLSQFTLYLVGALLAGVIAVVVGNFLASAVAPLFGTADAPGFLLSPVMQNVLLLFAVLIGGAFAAEISFLFGLPVLTLGSDYFGIATLGFSIVVQTLMVNTDTILPFPEMKGGRGMIGIPKLTTWFWAFAFMLVIIIIMRNLIYSSTGRAIMSVREDETAGKAMGINVAHYKLLSFVIGSAFAGIAGGIYAHYIGFLSPGTFSFILGFNPLIIIVFGGLGSMTGTIAASFAWIFFLEGLLRVLLGQMGTEAPTWRFVLYPIALLLLMLLRPTGLLGTREWGFLKRPVIPLRQASSTEAQPPAGDMPAGNGMQPVAN